ncbi:MAG: hypothetical protein OXH36_04925 [Bdellovibrionales bacterium]|nr:hypothetical protein [Bdellovibrionales bacterium]
MSIFESMKQEAQALRSEINEFLKIDREELYGEKRLHQLSFNHNGKKQFEAIFGLIEELSKCHFDRVPQNKISSIRSRLQTYKEIFERAKNLNLQDDSSPKSTRDNIVQELESNYAGFFNEASPVINFANQAGTDFKQIEREARQTLEQVKAHSEEQKNQMENQKKSAESILESMRKASAEAGVSQEAIHFSEAQKNHSKKAEKWYKWGRNLLIGLIVSLFITGMLFVSFKGKEALVLGYLEITVLIIISLWIYAVNFCNKNFHAEKHNETINANKARTLASFNSFVAASKNENITNQVLLHASASAFSNPPTGFGKTQGVPLPPGMEFTKQIASHSPDNT